MSWLEASRLIPKSDLQVGIGLVWVCLCAMDVTVRGHHTQHCWFVWKCCRALRIKPNDDTKAGKYKYRTFQCHSEDTNLTFQ